MTSPLHPCPFCGSDDLIIVTVDRRDREGLPAAVQCVDRGARGPWDYIQDEAHAEKIVGWWNGREGTS